MTESLGKRGREPRRLVNPEIIEAFAAGVMSYGSGKVARALRKSDSQLYNEMNCNGDQTKAKLGVDDALEATKLTGDVSWLAMFAADLGYDLLPKDAIPDKATVAEELADDTKKLGRFAEVVMDPHSTPKQIREPSMEARRDIRETETLAITLRQGAKKRR